MSNWTEFVNRLKYPKNTVNIGLIGKYVELQDSYKSILEALVHAGSVNETKVVIHSIHSEFIDDDQIKIKSQSLMVLSLLLDLDLEELKGKIKSIKYVGKITFRFLEYA